MAELRHSSSIGNRATPSPTASAVASSPLSSDFRPSLAEDDDHEGRDRHPRDRSLRSCFQSFIPSDDLYRPHAYSSKISIFILVSVALAAMIAISSFVKGLVWFLNVILCMHASIRLRFVRNFRFLTFFYVHCVAAFFTSGLVSPCVDVIIRGYVDVEELLAIGEGSIEYIKVHLNIKG